MNQTPADGSWQVGCVSYLNSKPLIEPIVQRRDCRVHFAVPADLLNLLETGQVQAALTPVVDYQTSTSELVLVPAGGICCDGPTLTVRIYSPSPPAQIRRLYADTDSHTSVILSQVVLRELYGVQPEVIALKAAERHRIWADDAALLLIGDKVVNAAPNQWQFPVQLDLGEQWKRLTGLPFVFAMWMMRADALDESLARILADARRQGRAMTDELVSQYAASTHWPPNLARRYFTQYLKYDITPGCRQGLELFYQYAHQLNLLPGNRPIRYFDSAEVTD
jgi:chorismate dehydratase